MRKPKVFVVQPIQDVAMEALKKIADVELFDSDRMISRPELKEGLSNCDYVYLLGAVHMDKELIDVNPNLKGIATMQIYPTMVDVDAATDRKIPVTIVPHVIKKTTAELTVALVIGVAWRIVDADRHSRAGRYRQAQGVAFITTALEGKVVGMIGLGDIGKEVVKRLRGFEMDIRYTKRNRLSIDEEEALGVTWVADRDDLLRESDFVVLMTTYNPSTHNLISARELDLMKPSAFLINSSRGRVLDEAAFVEAMREKKIAGAGLDVFVNEPPVSEPDINPELFGLENVLLTPHMGSATREARDQMTLAVVDNLRAMIEGVRPPDVVNPELYGEPAWERSDRTG